VTSETRHRRTSALLDHLVGVGMRHCADGASESDGNDNRSNGGHNDQGADALVRGVPIANDAREDEQGYQAAECVSFE
jgi:hypothetical protein